MSEPLLVRGPPVGDPLWIIVSEQSTHFGWSFTGGSIIVERIVVKYFVGNFWFISCSHLTFHSSLDSFVMVSL